MDYQVPKRKMTSGIGEAEKRKYRFFKGKSGKAWLVADVENAAEHIYVEGGKNSQGFGGAELEFELASGDGVIKLKGPWHSNCDAFFCDTGVDIRDKHYTFVIVSRSVEYPGNIYNPLMKDVLYMDKEPCLGSFYRGDELAQKIANELNETVKLYSESSGGSVCKPVEPK